MVRNGNEAENPCFSLVAATFEKAMTWIFWEIIAVDRQKLLGLFVDRLLSCASSAIQGMPNPGTFVKRLLLF
jgi:hypothetical protein